MKSIILRQWEATMPKPFHEIETDAEYLRAVGMGHETHSCLWVCNGIIHGNKKYPGIFRDGWADEKNIFWKPIMNLFFHDTDPACKWRNFANAIRVLGPEMDRRGWYLKREDQQSVCYAWLRDSNNSGLGWAMNALPHLALLEAFYNAHAAQGDDA